MKKLGKFFLIFNILIFTNTLKCTMYEWIQESDKIKEKCAYKCIKDYCNCTKDCLPHYVITDCMEDCCCLDNSIEVCLTECDKARSDYLNEAIKSFCLDPWASCPSCAMDF